MGFIGNFRKKLSKGEEIKQGYSSEQKLSADEEIVKKSLQRWKQCPPNTNLTWGRDITGDGFVKLLNKYNIFSENKNLLELGPGYGRVLSSIISQNLPFKQYVGIDLSQKNISMLKEKFPQKNIEFIQGNFSEISLDKKFDAVFSTLVMQHQYPTFYETLENISRFVNEGGLIFFDLPEHGVKYGKENLNLKTLLTNGPKKAIWEKHNNNTYIGRYNREEIQLILDAVPLKLVEFDFVIHDEKDGKRLTVVAQK